MKLSSFLKMLPLLLLVGCAAADDDIDDVDETSAESPDDGDDGEVASDTAAVSAGDLWVTNEGSTSFTICSRWKNNACTGKTGTLAPGQNSHTKYGWDDVNGIKVPKAYALQKKIFWAWGDVTSCNRAKAYYEHVLPLYPYIPQSGGEFRLRRCA